ncbi:hypothetical protein LY76DRAFT_671964, partial [Colletotrichum caudatum]
LQRPTVPVVTVLLQDKPRLVGLVLLDFYHYLLDFPRHDQFRYSLEGSCVLVRPPVCCVLGGDLVRLWSSPLLLACVIVDHFPQPVVGEDDVGHVLELDLCLVGGHALDEGRQRHLLRLVLLVNVCGGPYLQDGSPRQGGLAVCDFRHFGFAFLEPVPVELKGWRVARRLGHFVGRALEGLSFDVPLLDRRSLDRGRGCGEGMHKEKEAPEPHLGKKRVASISWMFVKKRKM